MLTISDAEDVLLDAEASFMEWSAEIDQAWYAPLRDSIMDAFMQSLDALPGEVKQALSMMGPGGAMMFGGNNAGQIPGQSSTAGPSGATPPFAGGGSLSAPAANMGGLPDGGILPGQR